MNKASNVIDLNARRSITRSAGSTNVKSLGRTSDSANAAQASSGAGFVEARGDLRNSPLPVSVLDMTARRQEMLTSERREVKRTILSEFIGAFIVIPQKGLQRVSIYDISESGLAFDLDSSLGQLSAGEEVAVRVYMNQQTYFPFIVKVSNARRILEEGVARHGCTFLRDTINEVALTHFVKFIENIAASLETDNGDVMVSNIGGR